ncbi:DsrE/DsrF-like family protein [compost metagenome]
MKVSATMVFVTDNHSRFLIWSILDIFAYSSRIRVILQQKRMEGPNVSKVAIILHATEAEKGRAIHSLVYAQELHEAGHEVKLIFDGQGVLWINKFEEPSHMMNPLFKAVKKLGVVEACGHCANSFNVTKEVEQANVSFSKDINAEEHTSIAVLVTNGWQIITL